MKRLLQNDNYQTETLNLLSTGSVPADAAVLVVGGPTSPLQQEEIDAINKYTAAAGHLYLLVDPASAANVQPLVDGWGITFNGVVVDTASFLQIGQRANPLVPVIEKYNTHPVTRDLIQNGSPSVFVEATAINVPTDRQTGVTITKLVDSSTAVTPAGRRDQLRLRRGRGYARTAHDGRRRRGGRPQRAAPTARVRGQAAPPPQPKTRAVIFGDSDFASNNFVRLGPGNRDFFLNSINWLSGSDELAAIRPKPPDQRQLFMTSVQRNAIFFSR